MEVKFKTKHIIMLSKITSKMEFKIDVKGKTKDEVGQMEMGAEMIVNIFNNVHKAEDEFYELLGSLMNCTIEDAKEMELKDSYPAIKAVVVELISFFKKPVE